jgi:predicted AAA+ superfamily ATPase
MKTRYTANVKKYYSRIVDDELKTKLRIAGAVVIYGPKACGKSETAKQLAKSRLQVDSDENVETLISVDPARLLAGATPRLIDEWQAQPKLWNLVRHEVDDRGQKGQFILTGSPNPEESVKTHSGAHRILPIDMRTMSWSELGYSTNEVSLGDLLNGQGRVSGEATTNFSQLIDRLIIGGWPENIGLTAEEALINNKGYIQLLSETDMSRVSGIKRDPAKVYAILKSFARNVSTLADIATIARDTEQYNISDKEPVSRPTTIEYLNTLSRLRIIENQPAWNTHIRSADELRKTPKKHFADPSLAVAALSLSAESLKNDLNYTGFLFESLVVHDLRVYAQANSASVYHYKDTSKEVDAIVQHDNGDWAAFEVKMAIGQDTLDAAAAKLIAFANSIDTDKTKRPKSLNIITSLGYAYTRSDGVNVVPLGNLGI